jgi:hypothetical protein
MILLSGSEILAASDETTAAAIISTSGALIGVFVGGLVTAYIESVRQGRREKRLERAAGRMLSNELEESRDGFGSIADQRVVRREAMPSLVPSWEQYRELLATRMEETGWRELAAAVLTARRVGGQLAPFAASDAGVAQLPTALVEEVARASTAAGVAASRLARLDATNKST